MALNLKIEDIDNWIETLMECKQLPENEVKKLCEKVTLSAERIGQGSSGKGIERSASKVPSDCLW